MCAVPTTEPEYTKAFLLTHHAFTSSRVVLDYLLKRYLTCSEEIERASLPPPAEEPKGSTTPEKKDKKDKKKKKEGEGAPTPPPPPEEAGAHHTHAHARAHTHTHDTRHTHTRFLLRATG
jgi:hypothetical protein